MSRNSLLETGAISNGIETHNHLVCKQTLNHLTELVKVFIYELSGCRFESRYSHMNSLFNCLSYSSEIHTFLVVISYNYKLSCLRY